MKTSFPKQELHIPKIFLIDVKNHFLGHIASKISILLRGKTSVAYTPGINQGNFVILINSDKILISGKKNIQKKYYKTSNRPGNLKVENYNHLKNRLPARILEKAIWGMLPKNSLGRNFYKRLYIYKNSEILLKELERFNLCIQKINL